MYPIEIICTYIIYYLNFKEKKVTHTSVHVYLLLLNENYYNKFKKKLFLDDYQIGKYSVIYPKIYKEFYILSNYEIKAEYITYNYEISSEDVIYLNHLLDYYCILPFLDLLNEGLMYSKKKLLK